MLLIPKRGHKTRWLTILCGLAVFLWLSPEDQQVLPVAIIGMLSSGVIVLFWSLGMFGGKLLAAREVVLLVALLGGLIGFGASLITTLLMLLKNVRHAHVYPDFPLGLIGAILQRAPIWGIAGTLIGIGIGVGWLAWRSKR